MQIAAQKTTTKNLDKNTQTKCSRVVQKQSISINGVFRMNFWSLFVVGRNVNKAWSLVLRDADSIGRNIYFFM